MAQVLEPAPNQHIGQRVKDAEQVVEKAVFSNFETTKPDEAELQNLDMLLDIPLEVKVRIGATKKTIRRKCLSIAQRHQLLNWISWQVSRSTYLSMTALIAKGEVVVIDENFGVTDYRHC